VRARPQRPHRRSGRAVVPDPARTANNCEFSCMRAQQQSCCSSAKLNAPAECGANGKREKVAFYKVPEQHGREMLYGG